MWRDTVNESANVRRNAIESCFQRPVIPVVLDPIPHRDLLAHASTIYLQGGTLSDLIRKLEVFEEGPLRSLALFVHIDLIAGVEKNDAGLGFLAECRRLTGIVTANSRLVAPARRCGLLTIVRVFLPDSRALDRGLAILSNSHPDVIEIMPAAVAPKVADAFRNDPTPRIAGGLCRSEQDVRQPLQHGCQAVTSTSPRIWQLNQTWPAKP